MPTTNERTRRWDEVLSTLADLVPTGPASVVVHGAGGDCAVVADRLAAYLHTEGRPSARLTDATPTGDEDAWQADRTIDTVAVADGHHWYAHPPTGRWDVVIWLRSAAGGPSGRKPDADVVVDLHDPDWPVIRHVDQRFTGRGPRWYLTECRAFFSVRADTWDTRFGDDLPAYAAAVADAGIPTGATVVDAGCGTGRALPALRTAAGPTGVLIGLDLTPQMLARARPRSRAAGAHLVLGDARQLPLATATVDAIFAAGLVMHLPDFTAGLAELARITRPSGRLVIFHPSGRVALAARHGRTLRPDEPLAESQLAPRLASAGWQLSAYDDATDRFLAVATRTRGESHTSQLGA
jgi:SAM-dependent methyltransferase